MTSEAVQQAPKRYRVGSRGSVHELRPGETLVTRCGVMIWAADETDEPVTCRTCLGTRAVRTSARKPSPAASRADLRLSDRAMYECENVTERAWDEWLRSLSEAGRERGHREAAPPGVYPAAPKLAWRVITHLQQRYEGRLNPFVLASSVTAHEELLRLQGYLLPGGSPESDS